MFTDGNKNIIKLEIPEFYPKQVEFLKAKERYVNFGGARGGG